MGPQIRHDRRRRSNSNGESPAEDPSASLAASATLLGLQRTAGNARVTRLIRSAQETASPLAEHVRRPMEYAFGTDLSSVRIHTGREADTVGRAFAARAVSVGEDIYFRSGRYAPESRDGSELLAHELAHVAQRRRTATDDVRAGRLVSSPSDSAETEARAVARRAAAGEPVEVRCEPAPISLDGETSTTTVQADLVGHASPRWEHRHGRTREELNLELSADRVAEVELYLRELFARHMVEADPEVEVTAECVDDAIPMDEVSSSHRGDEDTLQEAGGETRANDPAMRRVDIGINVVWHVSGDAPSSVPSTETVCEEHRTTRWAIGLNLAGGAGHAGLGGAFAVAQLTNRQTGQQAPGIFVGGGIGIGLQNPGADPGWTDPTNFETDSRVTFDDFDGTLARLTTAGAGFLIGGGLAFISFPLLGANSINVSGFTLGNIGADAGSNVGVFNITGTPPQQPCEDRHLVRTEYDPYAFDLPNAFGHVVRFDTGVATVSETEFALLDEFVAGIAAAYDRPTPNATMP